MIPLICLVISTITSVVVALGVAYNPLKEIIHNINDSYKNYIVINKNDSIPQFVKVCITLDQNKYRFKCKTRVVTIADKDGINKSFILPDLGQSTDVIFNGKDSIKIDVVGNTTLEEFHLHTPNDRAREVIYSYLLDKCITPK